MPSRRILAAFDLDEDSVEPIPGGLINLSFLARRADNRICVLQRVNPVFPAVVNDDIDAVTTHLGSKGLITPKIVRTSEGATSFTHEGDTWRVLTRVDGTIRHSVDTDAEALEAGRVLGEFHRALDDFDHRFAATREGVHDLGRHIGTLERALQRHRDHPEFAAVRGIADGILALAARLEPLPETPLRIVHGDPKISNVIFAGDRAVCLIDLDTVAPMALPLELGDALRSWCDPAGEDSSDSEFSAGRFRASLEGYRSGAGQLLSATEWQALPLATLTISVELAARFAADALTESYFAWDPARFESHSHHNRTRAAGQLALARAIETVRPDLQRIVMTLM